MDLVILIKCAAIMITDLLVEEQPIVIMWDENAAGSKKRTDLTVSKQRTETGVIKIHSTRTRDPLRQRKEIFFHSQKRRDEFPIMLSISLKLFTPPCISIQTAY
ncbi:hypothetical protein CEXT_384271 [Caerostris extrusa]|uniref:Uncharacterized protein n=1 Tax=Caerostris extrusa TaxID=172846 RepID=A0AAV4Y363_CAEEX|nr:hypothetical protein CEXT_384271 [Caerostris extrusa]